MWHWLGRFESLLFYLPFLIYASLRHFPYSVRCRNCGRWLFYWEHCRIGVCQKCAREVARRNLQQLPENAYSGRVATNVTCLCEHLHGAIVKRLGFGGVLDVGCGKGYLLSRLQSPHRELYGIDISPAVIKWAKVSAPETSLCVADVKNLPFKSDSFDWLICTEVLEHIEGDEAIQECFRVLKSGGRALFTVPNKSGPQEVKTVEHVRSFTFASFAEYVQQAGFEIVSARKMGLYIPILTYTLRVLSGVINKNIPLAHPLGISVPEFLAANFFIECRK